MPKSRRVVIIGLDGAPFSLIKSLSSQGVTPAIKEIISKGSFRRMQSSIPEISSVAWSTLVTGKNPAEHGIFGFTDLYPDSYRLRFPNFRDLKVPAFWEKDNSQSVIINVPATYPARPMNGVHISGFVSIDLEKSVYPVTLVPKLKELDYRLDVSSELAHKSLDLFLEDLDKTLEARIKTYKYLWDYCQWNNFMLVFTGTDRLMHFLWEAYEDPGHKYHNCFLEHFRKIDAIIGEISKKLTSDDLLIILSDHGFERLDKDVYINYFLQQEEFLKFQAGQKPNVQNLDSSSKAFALDPARIYINTKGKYPGGSVNPADKEKVIKSLEDIFSSWEIEGKSPIKRIYRKQEVYSGPFLDAAPDLILMANQNFNLKSSLNTSSVASKGIFTGKHTFSDAFILVNDQNLAKTLPENPDVSCLKRLL